MLATLLFILLIPVSLTAQSGRRRAEPSTTPAPNAPRRPVSDKPASDNLPGQPATPDAPGTTPQQNESLPLPTAATGTPAATPNAADEAVEIDDGEIVRVSSNLVPVSATVTDTRGKAITDLTVEDFELRVDGQPKPIGGLSHAETPVRLVLLFDNSDSIRASREFEKQAAIRFFKSVLRPIDQAAIYSVDSVYALEQPLTNDVSKLVRTIESFNKPEGATKLFDAMAHAAEYLRLQPGRKVLVLVTDGADTVSDLSYDETLRRIIAADCQVYAVQTGIIENANLYDLMAVRRLEVFSDRTGGAVYIPKNTNDLDTAFTQIAADLAQQYVLSYYPTDEGRDGRFRTINLRVKTRPSLRVRARRGYYPRRSSNVQQLSALPEHFVSAVGAHQSSNRDEPPHELDQPLTRPRQVAGNARTTVSLAAPVHGNKNMDAETSGDAPARNELDLRVVNSTAGDLKPSLPDKQLSGMKSEVQPQATPSPAFESPPQSSPETDATPTPTPVPATSTPREAATDTPAQKAETISTQTSTPPAQAAAQMPLSVGQLNAKAVKLPKPSYPETARRLRIGGMVKVEVVVDENGRVISAQAVSGHTLLRGEAVAAARQAIFTPMQSSGQAVRFSGIIIYNFSL